MASQQHATFRFDNTYRRLPDRFYALLKPAPVTAPKLIKLNTALAETLGLDPAALTGDAGAQIFSGSVVPAGAEPLAMAYAGHQFGQFVPQLGDGRAVLLGEVIGTDKIRRDIQLKGSGRTPFSRGGDGRAALGPVLREYIVSEAMHALGIPTTRSLAAVTTGEPVIRESILPGAVLTRVAAGHVRVGTFQYFAAREDADALKALCDYVIDRHHPQARQAENPALSLLEAVGEAQAKLVAQWMSVGFIHGVMNTDNMTISGETIDYGPCAFMDTFDDAKVFSSIDQWGRYAYAAQPGIAQWNLARLAETLLALIDSDIDKAVEKATAVVIAFSGTFDGFWLAQFGKKLGLAAAEPEDAPLIRDFLAALQAGEADFTLAFRRLGDALDPATEQGLRALFKNTDALDAWLPRWRARLSQMGKTPNDMHATMMAANPAFIPRNHRVEQAIEAAVTKEDFTPFETLVTVLSRPFDEQPDYADYADPPKPDEIVQRTFCGT